MPLQTSRSVSGVLPVDADSTEVPELISDAQITLIKDGVRYDLVHDILGELGYLETSAQEQSLAEEPGAAKGQTP